MSKNEEVVLSSKGQLVIPKVVREDLNMQAGRRMIVKHQENMILLILKPKDPLQALRGLRGRLKLGDMREEIKRHRRMEHRE